MISEEPYKSVWKFCVLWRIPKESRKTLKRIWWFSFQTVETDPTSQDANVDDMDTITSVSDAIIGNVALGMIDEEDDEEDAANAERRRPVTESKPLLN